jgi:hypothetical protein
MHRVLRLGETKTQTQQQIWHAVAEQGYTWGTWGLMNAPLGNPKGCHFFMPDPWSFDELAHPAYLNRLLALPRYAAKNYLGFDARGIISATFKLALFLSQPKHWPLSSYFAKECLKLMPNTKLSIHTLGTLFDYLSVLCFIHLRRVRRPNLSIIFLNHIAHLQHQFWHAGSAVHPEMRFGLLLSDAMIGLLLNDRAKDEALLLLNALKQKNVFGQGGFIYRQRNPQAAIAAMGIQRASVEQGMTNDAHLIFDHIRDADKAFHILDNSYLSDHYKAFYVERRTPKCVFYQVNFDHRVAVGTTINSENCELHFADIFDFVCQRTGNHVPQGDIYADGIEIPDTIDNHDVFHFMAKYFNTNSG